MEDYPTVTPDRERTQVLLAAIVARLKRMVQAGMACPPVPVQNVGDDRVRLGIESLFAQDVKVSPATLAHRARVLSRVPRLIDYGISVTNGPPLVADTFTRLRTLAHLDALKICEQMIRAVLMWEGIVTTSMIQDLCFKLVCGRVLPYLKTAPLSESLIAFHEAIVLVLPATWFRAGSAVAAAAVQLSAEPYVEHLAFIAGHTGTLQGWRVRISQIQQRLRGAD